MSNDNNQQINMNTTRFGGGRFAYKPSYVLIAVTILAALLGAVYLVVNNGNATTVASGDTIGVYYTGKLTNGTVFDSNVGGQPFQFTVGTSQVIQGFDQAVIGMKLNETKTVTIPVNEAYGPVNPGLIIKVPLSQFGNQNVSVGMTVMQTSNGQQASGVVTAVNSTTATIDFNSRLAGQVLIFSIKVVKIQKKQ